MRRLANNYLTPDTVRVIGLHTTSFGTTVQAQNMGQMFISHPFFSNLEMVCSWGMCFDPPTGSHLKSQQFSFLPLNSRVFPVTATDPPLPSGSGDGEVGDLSCLLRLCAPSLDRQTILGDVER